MSPGDRYMMVAALSAVAAALAFGGLVTLLVLNQAGLIGRRVGRIEAVIAGAASPVPEPYRRLVDAATEALAAYRVIFRTCWNDRDRRAFAELEAALRKLRS